MDPGEIVAVLKRIFRENGREYLPQYVGAVVCLLAVAATTAFSAWIMRDIVDEIFYRENYDLVPVIASAIVVAFIIRGAATYGQAVLLARVGNNLVARYQRRLFDHLMRLGLDFFSDRRSGQLAAQISQNVTGIRDMLSVTLTSIARDAVALIGLVAVMVLQDPLLSVIALLIGPPLVFTVNYLMRRLRRVTRESVEVNSRLFGAMQETVQGIAIVKAFTMEEQLARKLAGLVDAAERRANRIARVSERLTPISEILAGLAIAGVIVYAAHRAQAEGQSPGSVFAFITALLLAYDPARRLARVQVNLERAMVNARMIYELLDLEPPQRDVPGARLLDVGGGAIAFEKASFSYDGETRVVDDVSFTADAGKVTAIVGASGAGKSTLVTLVQRFYDLDAGRILIDGQDIAAVTKSSLRRQIAYVSQHPYLFEGTVRDNIAYGREGAGDDEIRAAARLANADGFISQMADGYDTLVGENGVTLSGGQRQRISIARAIVRQAPILLLDEATSALDNESEARVQEALETIMKDRTTIVIAHRLSTVVNADMIIVMEEGRIAETGKHATLLADPASLYARYHRLQGERGLELRGSAPESGMEPKSGMEKDI